MSPRSLNGASLLDAQLALPRGCVPDPDEDAITRAAEAALPLLERTRTRPDVLILATTEPPYDEGGNVQPLAELLGLSGSLVALELTASLRDGLSALRVAAGLLATDAVGLVCASEPAGAVALLLAREGGIARIVPLAAHVEELRDRWRLARTSRRHEADPSFVSQAALDAATSLVGGPAAFVLSDRRAAARAERACGGPPDPLPTFLGAAHAPARLVLALERPLTIIAAASGLVEATRIEPADDATTVAVRARRVLEREQSRERSAEPPPAIDWQRIDPYVSAPRSWRERAQDLRLEGGRCRTCGRLLYPPPLRCPSCGSGHFERERLSRTGTVVTCTRDHAYPLGPSTGMAVVDLDGGGRFYGQVAPSETVDVSSRVRLVPRRLHLGGEVIQYFWKVSDADRG